MNRLDFYLSVHSKRKKLSLSSTRFIIHCIFLLLTSLYHSVYAETSDFDHFNTGYPLSGMHLQVDCQSCHIKGVFKGSPRTCAGCHNNQIASGKPINHMRTPDLCDNCHTTFAFEAATFDHGSVTARCSQCHNGSTATGKHARHFMTNIECDECHITTAWMPASFHHDAVTGSCRSCHTKDLPRDHLVTSADCDACHLSTAWKPARFDHNSAIGICSSCHEKDKPTNHFITAKQCDECHNNRSWQPARYDHSFFTIEHSGDVDCSRCHTGNNESVSWARVDLQPYCAGCHAGNYKQDSHKKFANSDVTYTVDELKDCAGACHKEGVPLSGHHSPNKGW